MRTLRGAGHTAYFAGGCVRDELLGLSPTDYDVATDATPDRIKALFKRTDEVGAAFGVVLVTVPVARGKATVEVATFRSDGPYSDGRRPDAIWFSDPESDARRRDFTVNALFLDPLAPGEAGSNGRVIDLVNGMADLRAKVLRAVGVADERLGEDHLRALRAVRLAARLGFSIDRTTEDAIRRHASDLAGVSRERIGDEVRRIMGDPSRGRAMDVLTRLGLDAPVLQEPHREGSCAVLAGLPPDASFPLALAAWAIDRAGSSPPPAGLTGRWREVLMLSNDETAGLQATLQILETLRREWPRLTVAVQKRVAARPESDDALTLLSLAEPARGTAARARVRELASDGVGLAPAPLIDGDELVRMGMTPGPRFKRILDGVYDAQLEGRVRTLEQARELARTLGVQ